MTRNILFSLISIFSLNSQDIEPVEWQYDVNKINDTDITRLSFDFRILPRDKYNKDYPHKTSTKNLSYTIGEYYLDSSFIK